MNVYIIRKFFYAIQNDMNEVHVVKSVLDYAYTYFALDGKF